MTPMGTTGEVDGETAILVGVWFTVTEIMLVVERLLGSVMVAVKLKVPAWVKMAVIFLAALVPLAAPE